jgi:hypothetical protein
MSLADAMAFFRIASSHITNTSRFFLIAAQESSGRLGASFGNPSVLFFRLLQ